MDYLVCTLLAGIGATATIDLWALARKRLLGIALPNYGLVGRWLSYMPRGRFRHASIAAAPPIRGELKIGWAAHYLIGVAFAAIVTIGWGLEWFQQPRIWPALLVGIGSVAAPFLLMQPGMGAGVAASRTPRPASARLHSLVTHTIFGLALYVSGWAISRFYTP